MSGSIIEMMVSTMQPGHWISRPGDEVIYEKDGVPRRLTEMCVLYELAPDMQCRAGRATLRRDEKEGVTVQVSHERMLWALLVDGNIIGDYRAYEACHAFDGQPWFDGGPL